MAAVQFSFPYDIMVKPGNLGTPNGKVYFYAAGGLTLRPVYASSSLTTQLSNPVIADGAGRLPAIYLDNALTYRVRAYDKSNALLIDRDPYIPGVAPDSAALAPYQAAAEAAAAASSSSATDAASSATAAHNDRVTADADAVATAADRVQTGLDRVATGNNATTSTAAATLASSSYNAIAAAIAPGSLNNATVNAVTRSILAGLAQSLPVYLSEAGREGAFVWSSANNATNITNDPNQGVYVAPASDTTGASGAWVRNFTGDIHAKWFGGTWDGVADDGPTIAAAIAFANATKTTLNVYGYGTRDIQLPFAANGINRGNTATISLTNSTKLKGYGSGEHGGYPTILKVGLNCNGIEIHGANCGVENLCLIGSYTVGMAEAEYHGIKAYQKFTYRNVAVYGFQGDGIHVNITAGSGGDTEGNANAPWGERIVADGNRCGISLQGADVNAGNFLGVDVNYNRRAGIFDNSFLGDTHVGPQGAGNGVTGVGGLVPYTCSFNNGFIFYCVLGQEAGASTNSPPATATSNTYWRYWKASGAATAYAPQWTNGMSVRAGGNYLGATANGQTVFINPYSEIDQAPDQLGPNALVVGGQGYALDPNTRYIKATINGVEIGPSVISSAGGFSTLTTDTVSYLVSGASLNSYSGYFSGNLLQVSSSINFGGNIKPGVISKNPGAGTPQPFWMQSSEIQWIYGADGLSYFVLTTTGLAVKGSILSSGTAGVGYSTGAGGAVTQLTSKSTAAPAINKACGQITMNGAALAAGAKVSFAVPNSVVVGTDVVSVSVASGGTASAYRAAVTAVGAGTFTITVENITAGSLSEAPVINFAVVKAVPA